MAEYLVYLDSSFLDYSGVYEADDESAAVRLFVKNWSYVTITPEDVLVVLNLRDSRHYNIVTEISITPV